MTARRAVTCFHLILLPLLIWPSLASSEPSKRPGAPAVPPKPLLHPDYGRLPLAFEPNVGQTDDRVKFLARTGGSTLTLTGEGVMFLLAAPVPTPRSSDPVEVRIRLLGANRDARPEAVEKLPGIVNYFIGNDPGKWRSNIPTYSRVRFQDVYEGIDLVCYGTQAQLEYDFVVAPGADPALIRAAVQGADELKLDARGDLVIRAAGLEIRQRRPHVYQDIAGRRREVGGDFTVLSPREYAFRIGAYDPQQPVVIDPTVIYSTNLGLTQFWDVAADGAGNAYVAGMQYPGGTFPVTPGAYQRSVPNMAYSDIVVAKFNALGTALEYATYIGAFYRDEAAAIAVDRFGNAYITGSTTSADFPVTPGAFQDYAKTGLNPSPGVQYPAAFVVKLNPTGSALVYSTYLSGGGRGSEGRDIVVDTDGNAYVTGFTASLDFPTTPGAFRTSPPGSGGSADAFVAKLNPAGSGLVYSTYLGGIYSDIAEGIAVDGSGNAYVTGATESANFPTTPAAFQPQFVGNSKTFVSKLNLTGSELVYSTYLGGTCDSVSCRQEVHAIAVDGSGSAYVTGWTTERDFPTTPGAYQRLKASMDSVSDAFVTKLKPDGSDLAYSTFLGAPANAYAWGYDIAVDSSGSAWVAGRIEGPGFPATQDALQPNYAGPANSDRGDAFLARLNPPGSGLLYSTYLGGSTGTDVATGVALDGQGQVYLAGYSTSSDFPVSPGALQRIQGSGFVVKLSFGAPPPLALLGVQPNRGGDTGSVSVLVVGTGLQPATTVKLVRPGQSDIPGLPVSTDPQGRYTFDLSGKARGAWDLAAVNPDGASATLLGAFTIEQGRAPEIWLDVIGPSRVRPGQTQTVAVIYTNRGNTDAEEVPVWIRLPKGTAWKARFEVAAPPLPQDQVPADWTQVPIHTETQQDILIPILVPIIPPGWVGVLPIDVVLPAGSQFEVRAWANPPMVQRTGIDLTMALNLEWQDCFRGISQTLVGMLGVTAGGCATPLVLTFADTTLELHKVFVEAARGKNLHYSLEQFYLAALSKAGQLIPACLVALSPISDLVFRAAAAVQTVMAAGDAVEGCTNALTDTLLGSAGLPITVVASIDPNTKTGSAGVTGARYLWGQEPLQYAIFFENLAGATAPAQQVVVTDQLDPALVELNTFSLGQIIFGDRQVFPPSFAREFAADVDLRPARNLIARISASLNASTGLVTWQFTSIDPASGQPTTDPLAGFLPPNGISPEGQGSVMFNVVPKAALPTGTQVRNRATIVFDFNAPLLTPEWVNTLDNTKPESQVLALPAVQGTPLEVRWSGTDQGAGIADYSIYVSDNGGPFTRWLSNVSQNSSSFAGQPGHTYGFYSIARDYVGNVEDAPASADATTRVQTCADNVSAQVSVTRGGFRLNYTAQRYVQSVVLKNTGGSAVAGPVSLVLDSLSANAALFNKTGVTGCAAPLGSAYVNANVGADNALTPGETATVVLEFTNPTNRGITYNTRVLAGAGTR